MNAIHKENKHFWSFASTHFTYFFIWAIVYGYLTLWLEKVAHLNGTESGFIFSFMAGISLLFQPIFGILSDKLVFKKNLLVTITLAAILVGPFFQWLFLPIVHTSSFLAAIVAGLYLSFILNGGVGVVEQYVERASLVNKFEYGHSRMGGSLAGMTASLIAGRLFIWQPNSIFWACSVSAVILTCLVLFSDKVNVSDLQANPDTDSDNESAPLDKKTILSIFKLKNFWVLSLFYMGAAAIYDVFDQQFIVYFTTFFKSASQGTITYSYMASAQTAIELLLMIPMPFIINKIGAKKGLIAFGFITFIRIFGSAIAPNWELLVFFRLLAGLEMPLLLVSIMKYITGAFDIRLYATVYLMASNFAKQISVFIFSTVAGKLYDVVGFQKTYFILSAIVFVITLVAAFMLEKEHPLVEQTTGQPAVQTE